MKGFSLPITAIVGIVIAVIVLVYLSFFFLGFSGAQMSRAKAEQVYSDGCMEICGATKDALLSGVNIAYDTEGQYTQFKEACVILGYIPRTSSEPVDLAAGVITCLQTCGNCYIEEGPTEQYLDCLANCANAGISEEQCSCQIS